MHLFGFYQTKKFILIQAWTSLWFSLSWRFLVRFFRISVFGTTSSVQFNPLHNSGFTAWTGGKIWFICFLLPSIPCYLTLKNFTFLVHYSSFSAKDILLCRFHFILFLCVPGGQGFQSRWCLLNVASLHRFLLPMFWQHTVYIFIFIFNFAHCLLLLSATR